MPTNKIASDSPGSCCDSLVIARSKRTAILYMVRTSSLHAIYYIAAGYLSISVRSMTRSPSWRKEGRTDTIAR